MHTIRKLKSTINICFCLGMARMFGTYLHSVGGGEFEYAVYVWRGDTWAIPTGPYDKEYVQ